MNELLTLTLIELAEALRERKASPVELMEATLARIDEANGDLNAVVAMHDRGRLLDAAREAEARIGRGEARPLEGIPLGVKDLEDTEGLVTSMGSLPFKDRVATQDTTQVARLKAAGAIVLGKTNAPEFGYTAITKNLVYGVTRSPWNLERTPGGSSGGSAAALSSGNATPRNGERWRRLDPDPGELRTGAFGLKVSYGRVPLGSAPTSGSFGDTAVSGPLTTQTVEDAALFLDQVVGAVAVRSELPAASRNLVSRRRTRRGAPGRLRIAYSPDLGYAVVQTDVAEAVFDGVKAFEKLGHSVEEIAGGPPPNGSGLGPLWRLRARGQAAPVPAPLRAGVRTGIPCGREARLGDDSRGVRRSGAAAGDSESRGARISSTRTTFS